MRGLWRFKVKTQHGKVTSFKSRYCADGSHVNDLPENVYTPTASLTSINMMLLMSSLFGIPLKSGDIPSAYVQAQMPSDRNYYVTQPPGAVNKDFPDHILKLKMALYGVPCAGHQWNLCNWFLGMNITQDYTGVFISQKDYIATLVKDYDKVYARKHDTPGDSGENLEVSDNPNPDFQYQKLVGSLLWAVKNRPDIAFAVTQCCRFTSNFSDVHVKAALRIVGYLRKHSDYGLKFNVVPSWTPPTQLSI